MEDNLVNLGFNERVANFIANPEWLHMGTAALLMLLVIGATYLVRVDLDPFLFRRNEPFKALMTRLIFYPVLIIILFWTYYGKWAWPDKPVQGFEWDKFTIGIFLVLVLILGRAVIHFIVTEKNRWNYFDNFPFYLMVLYQFFVPLVSYNQLERNMMMPKEELGFALACIFIFYFILRWLIGRPTQVPRNPVSKWLWYFLAYMLLTVIIMNYRLAAVKNVIQWVAFGAIFFASLTYIPDRRRRDALILLVVITGLICTLWGFWKYFDVPLNAFQISNGVYPEGDALAGKSFFYKTPSAGRYFLLAGFFANPNYFGEYLAMTIFAGLGLLFSSNSLKLRQFLAIATAVNTFEMVALYNRAGWFGIFVGLSVVIFALFYARLAVFKRVSKAGFAFGLIGLIFILGLTGIVFNARENDDTPLSDTPFERLKSMTKFSEDETFRNRLTMWRSANLMIMDPEAFPQRLIFGGGFGFFEVQYLVYQTKVLESYDFNEWFHNVIPTFRAHNDHIQMIVEAGLIGFGLYATFFILFFIYGFGYLKSGDSLENRFYALGIIGALACLLAIACFSFPLHQIEHGAFILMVMGFLTRDIVEWKQRVKLNPALSALEAGSSTDEIQDENIPRKLRKKLRKSQTADKSPGVVSKTTIDKVKKIVYTTEFFKKLQGNVRQEAAIPIIVIALFLCIWGVYTQIANFKGQFYVVKGIAALRNIQADSTQQQKEYVGAIAADFFWKAYLLDPTNGRAEFFHGFALIKKNVYNDVKEGTKHVEEGQLTYPQSDTHYALAMGYEARRDLGKQVLSTTQDLLAEREAALQSQDQSDEERTSTQAEVEKLKGSITELEADIKLSQDRAILAYKTAAEYYPVKVEYYNELIKLYQIEAQSPEKSLEERKGFYEDIIFWTKRALVVDAWLLQKPPIRWQLYLSLIKAYRALAAISESEGKQQAEALTDNQQTEQILEASRTKALDYLSTALSSLKDGFKEAEEADKKRKAGAKEGIDMLRFDYYYDAHFEIAQAYESVGSIYESKGDLSQADEYFKLARDAYIETFNRKDHVLSNQPPFDYIFFLMGRISEKLDEPETAVQYYRQLLTISLYSKNTKTYQEARKAIYDITGVWEGSPPDDQVVSKDEPVEP